LIRQQLAERFDVAAGGLIASVGDVAGSGSDTIRTRRATGYGWSKAMASLASETQAIAASPVTVGVDDITIGRQGLAFSESFQHAIQDDAMLKVDDLAGYMVDSYLATLRSLLCTTGATFATNSADPAATLDVNDWIALRADFEETAGFDGRAVAVLHPVQVAHLRSSIRSETALQYPESFELYQRMQAEAGFRFTFLGIDIYASQDVSLSGGDYYGFAYQPGAIAYAVHPFRLAYGLSTRRHWWLDRPSEAAPPGQLPVLPCPLRGRWRVLGSRGRRDGRAYLRAGLAAVPDPSRCRRGSDCVGRRTALEDVRAAPCEAPRARRGCAPSRLPRRRGAPPGGRGGWPLPSRD